MGKAVLIGVEANELFWLRSLVALLRHPDRSVGELARQAILYLNEAAGKRDPASRPDTVDHAG